MGSAACCSQDLSTITQPGPIQKNANLQKTSSQHLQRAVDSLFKKYDKDGSGYLDKKQVVAIIGAALGQMNSNRKASRDQVNSLIQKSDINKDGKISKDQLYKLFKKVAKV